MLNQPVICSVLATVFMSCASLSDDNTATDLKLEPTAESRTAISAEYKGIVSSYQFEKKEYKISWFVCHNKEKVENVKTFFLMHDEIKPFDEAKHCDDWRVQTFLNKGFRVVAANRPGFGTSTGSKDFIGPQSVEALKVVAQDFIKEYQVKNVDGIWGYSVGGSVAALLSRELKDVSWLLVGGGFFDFESVKSSTKDQVFKDVLESVSKHGENALTIRSVAYNVEGLPKNIYLYHGKNDVTSAVEEVKMFEETLSAMESKVTLQLLENQSHDMSIDIHTVAIQGIIDKILAAKD